jgi:hypothetical protein
MFLSIFFVYTLGHPNDVIGDGGFGCGEHGDEIPC